ncbi:hypothetical protein HanXRQr2_Chr04g0164751 [Helianthus annuus]|uniref:Uncharacterized protein n=1 Tax=Helianthus annuus TaxID=4232 RepID=A0A9K3J7Z2_HELAN|nr:hypothetical protein HanXRQr2_Chr04g0164751 [Helianthus annuus]KAJ0588703.1 hypothetical protein HanIR_Chr04g0177761 [Helianthus annuus]KAJ0931186.1 hypothetical protein HanPSC8_Chr04g0158611 [Helianthus annuus]
MSENSLKHHQLHLNKNPIIINVLTILPHSSQQTSNHTHTIPFFSDHAQTPPPLTHLSLQQRPTPLLAAAAAVFRLQRQ